MGERTDARDTGPLARARDEGMLNPFRFNARNGAGAIDRQCACLNTIPRGADGGSIGRSSNACMGRPEPLSPRTPPAILADLLTGWRHLGGNPGRRRLPVVMTYESSVS